VTSAVTVAFPWMSAVAAVNAGTVPAVERPLPGIEAEPAALEAAGSPKCAVPSPASPP
jgi:hypothetical protein